MRLTQHDSAGTKPLVTFADADLGLVKNAAEWLGEAGYDADPCISFVINDEAGAQVAVWAYATGWQQPCPPQG